MTPSPIDTMTPTELREHCIALWADLRPDLAAVWSNFTGTQYLDFIRKEGSAGWNPLVADKSPQERYALGFYQQNLAGLDLPSIDFAGMNLHKMVLVGAHIPKANFQFTNLTRARLEGIEAPGADFRGARLNMASFLPISESTRARLTTAQRTDTKTFPSKKPADLRNTDFRGALLFAVFFNGADLRRADFRGAYIQNTSFAGANLTGAHFDYDQVKQNLPKLLEAKVRGYKGLVTIGEALEKVGVNPETDFDTAVDAVTKILTTDYYRHRDESRVHSR